MYAPMQLPIKALKELIERIRYPGLRLNHLYVKWSSVSRAGAFHSFRRGASVK